MLIVRVLTKRPTVGKPKRHLLQDGWGAFCNSKKLVKGDMVTFLRGENGEVRIGIKKPTRQRTTDPSVMFTCSGIIAIAHHSIISGARFNVIYKPRKCQSEFIINVNKYLQAQKHRLSTGIRFMRRFEGEDLHERRSNGQIVHLQDNVSSRWPDSEWKSIKVQWDEPSPVLPEKVSPWELEFPLDSQPRNWSKQAQCTGMIEHNEGFLALNNKKKKLGYAVKGPSSITDTGDGAEMELDTAMNFNSVHNDFAISQENCSQVGRNILVDAVMDNECLMTEHCDISDYVSLYDYSSCAHLSNNHNLNLNEGNRVSDVERMSSRNDACVNNPSPEIDFDGICDSGLIGHTPTAPLSSGYTILSSEQQQSSIDVLSNACPFPSPSQQDARETAQVQPVDDCFKDFHGFDIISKHIPYLERICGVEGKFWENSGLKRANLISAVLNELGLALSMKDRTWNSLSSDELNIIIHSIEDGLFAGFKLDCLKPFLQQAKAVLASYGIRRQLQELQMQRNSLEDQLQNLLCQINTLDLEHKSNTEGLDFESRFLASIFD